MTESSKAAKLQALLLHGQSYWLDNLTRPMIRDGDLQRRVREEGLRGVTSNPAIFHKAISGSEAYDEQIAELVREGKTLGEIYEELVCSDVRQACDVLRPVYDDSQARDGYVSLEVSPHLIHDTEGSTQEGRRLWTKVGRPNLMIKIPGTQAGVPAIEQLLVDGINVNVTLLFSIQAYEQVAEAYIRALGKRHEQGLPLATVTSVASFFLSRIDTLVDHLLGHRIGVSPGAGDDTSNDPRSLFGKAGVASAKMAYARFEQLFRGPDWDPLVAAGAGVQRVLWASTSTKNPLYDDVMYIEPLIGPDSVNTMPEITIDAFADHGEIVTESVRQGVDEASQVLQGLEDIGIDLGSVTSQLVDEGAQKFIDPFDALVDGLAEKRRSLLDGDAGQEIRLPQQWRSGQVLHNALDGMRFVRRLNAADPALWTTESRVAESIRHRLGWLDSVASLEAALHAVRVFAESIRAEDFRHIVLLGMGGSSLTGFVAAQIFGPTADGLELLVVDDTDPASIRDVECRIDLERTLFLVASKSGTTLETMSLYRYFYARVAETGLNATGGRFVALTDVGSPLEREAQERGFRRTFETPDDVGGRFSALTFFGLLPMALLGVDLDAVIGHARRMQIACGPEVHAAACPGVALGAALAELEGKGRGIIHLVASESIQAFPRWIEQILAESTGKEGRGLIPVVHEMTKETDSVPSDRLLISIELEGDRALADRMESRIASGAPAIRIVWPSREAIGGEFVRWEVATATAGALMGINPFDEPDVALSKEATAELLREVRETGDFRRSQASGSTQGIQAFLGSEELPETLPANGSDGRAAEGSLAEVLRAFVKQASPEKYVAVLPFFRLTPTRLAGLSKLRRMLEAHGAATTLTQGPRYLHSTGQLHKGGPDCGMFLILTADPVDRIAIPETDHGFAELQRAQALGDYQALARRGRPVLRIDLGWYVAEAIEGLVEELDPGGLKPNPTVKR